MRSPVTLLVLVAVASCAVASAQAAATTWTIPGTVNAGGLNNTRFVSDLAVTNPGSAPVQATISFLPGSGTTPRQVTLGAAQTVVYRNVLDSLWGAQGAGATRVSSDAPLLIRARTYNTASSGTYGVALPVFADDRLLAAGETAESLWISQSSDGNSGYRTNVAVVFPDPSGGEARVTVFDADGHEAGSQEFSLDTEGFQQFAVGSFAGAVAIARAEIEVFRGPAAAYAVVVDNVTGDSSLFAFEDRPVGRQDVLVNGVARAGGRNNTFFRTDGRFFNPASEDAVVTVAFHDNRSSNPAPATRTFTVPAGKIRDVVDVLDALLGLPVGSAGALRFTSDTPVAILCRTSNVDPSGVKPGTFGAQQRPTPLLSFLMSSDAGAVTGIRQNSAFRTNVGFAAGEDGASFSLTLKSASGATVATAAGSLGPFGWTQPNVGDLFPGTTVPDDATLQVIVTAGSVDVFDSSIDNASGDPVVTPIMPVPADSPSSAVIGPAGGSVRSDDGLLTLKVPAGALTAATPISIAVATNDAPGAVGPAYDVSPAGLAFAKPALLALRYGRETVPVDGIDGAALVVLTGAGWAGLTGGQIDTGARTLAIGLRSTSPADAAPAARSARTSDAAPAATRFATNGALQVNLPTWLPTGGSAHLEVLHRGRPSSAGPAFGYQLISTPDVTFTTTWSLTLGSVDSTKTSVVTYTAPPRIKDVFVPVGVTVTVKRVVMNQDRTTTTTTDVLKREFKVIRRNFLFDAYYKMDLPCTGSNTSVAVHLANAVATFNYFQFDDDLSFHAGHNVFVGDPETPTVTSCGGHGCHDAATTGKTGNLLLNDLSGTFHGASGFFLLGENFQTNAFPPYMQQGDALLCTGSDGTDLFIPVILGPGTGIYWPLSNKTMTAQSETGLGVVLFWEFRSVDGDIPPEGKLRAGERK